MGNNFTYYRGDTQNIVVQFTDSMNTPINITGWTVFFTLKDDITVPDVSALISKDITSHTDPTLGLTTISLANTETDNLIGTYYYDVQYKDDSSNIETVLEGTMQFNEDVTRRTT